MSDGIFIPGNVPSSKNGRRWTGKYFIVSKQTADYYKATKKEWEKGKEEFLKLIEGKSKPYKVTFKFNRKSRRKFDYVNPAQTVQDQMVKYGWIDDDNMLEIVPVFLEYEHNKENPGVYINVLDT